jgi:uncharacterized protein (DUF1697 family)
MKTWIALFRAINVAGANRLPMADLVALLESEGCTEVRTYIQSGNAVFRAAGGSANALARRIGGAVRARCGFEPKVLVLGAAELADAVSGNPFPAAVERPATLHLFFLAGPASGADLPSLERVRTGREAFALRDTVFYLHTPDGAGNSKLARSAERHLKVEATARNWNTVTKLLRMADGKG